MSAFEVLKTTFINSPYFGICLSIAAFELGILLQKKSGITALTPLLTAIAICVVVLLLLGLSYSDYIRGARYVALFLAPATAVLAVPMYKQLAVLKKNIVPVIVGTTVGSIVCVACVFFMCKWFGVDRSITASLIPKSVTMPIALDLSASKGGIPSITAAAVMLAGNLGAMLSPQMRKLFRIKNPVAAGLAIGTASHVLGTTRALEMGEVEGAMSGIAIGCAGIITMIITVFLPL